MLPNFIKIIFNSNIILSVIFCAFNHTQNYPFNNKSTMATPIKAHHRHTNTCWGRAKINNEINNREMREML